LEEKGWGKQLIKRLLFPLVAGIVGGLVVGLLIPIIGSCISGEKQAREIVNQEAILVLQGKIEEVVSLYAEDAYIRDAAGGDTGLEIWWKGQQEIADRYRNLPQFTYLRHDAIEISISSDKEYARAVADTIGECVIGGKNVRISSNRGEKWVLEKFDGNWKITSFTYNLP
jgi:hypothetical protein